MNELYNTLLEKAKAAHYNWIVNNPEMEQIKAMAQLGDAIQDVEALAPELNLFNIEHSITWRGLSASEEKQRYEFWIGKRETDGKPYFGIIIRTLTKEPKNYGYRRILRRIGETFYIESSYAMFAYTWLGLFHATTLIKEPIEKLLSK